MRKSTSIFLDGLRLFAALMVFAQHFITILYMNSPWASDYAIIIGHAMVIVFFVLSGYVIAFSSLEKAGLTPKKYIVARLSRLYSVVVPALLLTAGLSFLGHAINPVYYQMYTADHEVGRYVATGLFLQSVWWHNLVPRDNSPFWSLGYEFWYYAIFGAVVFARGWKWKLGLILLCCLIVGENVLLLFPIWLVGVALYLYGDRFSIPSRVAAIGFFILVGLTILSIYALPDFPEKGGYAPHFYSGSFLKDWLIGIELGAVIWFYRQAFEEVAYPATFARGVQWAANHTFSLYLYHYPIIVFFCAAGVLNPNVWWQAIVEIALILGCIVALAELTESKRGLWKKALERAWDRWLPPVPEAKKSAVGLRAQM